MAQLGVIYGQDGCSMTTQLMERFQVEKDRPSWAEMVVGIKPNLVNDTPSHHGATTDPSVVEGIIQYMQGLGVKGVQIMESSRVGLCTHKAFKACGYEELSRRYGVQLINAKEDRVVDLEVEGEIIKVFASFLEVDYLINVPVLKAHCQTKITGAVKNLKGCIPDSEKRRFHREGLHSLIALLPRIIPVDLIILEGLYGDLEFEEGGRPVQMDRVCIGRDPYHMDGYAARLLGYSPADIEHLAHEPRAREEVECMFLNEPQPSQKSLPASSGQELFGAMDAREACSSCVASLAFALSRLKEQGIRVSGPIALGQGYKGREEAGVGIGSCTRGLSSHLPGCPPHGQAIQSFLRDYLHSGKG